MDSQLLTIDNGPSGSYKFHSAVWNVPASHAVLKYVTNSSILGNSRVSACIPCHARWTKEWKQRQELLFCLQMSLFAPYYICFGFADRCVNVSHNCLAEMIIPSLICICWKIQPYWQFDGNLKVSNHSLRFELQLL